MSKKGVTISEAAHKWVAEFNRFPHAMIAKLMSMECEAWREVTVVTAGDRVYVFDVPDEDVNGEEYIGTTEYGEVLAVEDDTYTVEMDDGTVVSLEDDVFEKIVDDQLPMWGWLWQFGDSCDDWWLKSGEGIRIMSECGFRIYEHDEYGYFFGIDGCGYDFYESHWIPLYKARGLKWHDEESEGK